MSLAHLVIRILITLSSMPHSSQNRPQKRPFLAHQGFSTLQGRQLIGTFASPKALAFAWVELCVLLAFKFPPVYRKEQFISYKFPVSFFACLDTRIQWVGYVVGICRLGDGMEVRALSSLRAWEGFREWIRRFRGIISVQIGFFES